MRARRRRAPALFGAGIAALIAGAGCGGGEPRDQAGSGGAAGDDGGPRSGLALKKLAQVDQPTHIAQPPGMGKLLLVTEKRGVVRVLENDRLLKRRFLDIRKFVASDDNERGLASIAFPPGYRKSRRFYVAYTGENGGALRVEEFRAKRKDPTRARRGTRRTVLEIPQPAPIHNGGQIAFGPDGRLYVGAGDGGPSYDPDNTAQKRKTLLGSIMRIEPRRVGKGKPYGIPKGNPFRGRGGKNEIFAYGLRNPWRFSFDRKTGALIIGDVGQDQIEEIDYVRPKRARGANFGWSGWEGTRPFKENQQRGEAVFPIHEYTHENRCSVTGGHVVRTPELPSLRGRYLYGDFCDGELRSLVPPSDGSSKDDRREGLQVDALVSFGEDDEGRIYVVSLAGGVYRLVERS
ncbi:MAG TPA: PQQ-dependent sugar dehydrogenase [Solirubrobacterales bacterium]|nr:PQQ-dependent sugar dehydrogenase [Solirubrobacterales bacterium]